MTVRVSLLKKAALAAGLLGIATASQAVYYGNSFTTLPYTTPLGLSNMDLDVNGTGSSYDSTNIGYVGFFGFTQDSFTGTADLRGFGGATDPDFYTICGQFEGLQTGQDFMVYDSDHWGFTAVQRGGAVAGQAVGLATAFEDALGSGDQARAAGFQIAVWAAVYGGGGAGTFNSTVTVGGFSATSTHALFYIADATVNSVSEWADYYYNLARNSGWGYKSLFLDSFVGTDSTAGQDQFTVRPGPPQSVPEPFSMALGIMGAGAYIRRRVKAKKA